MPDACVDGELLDASTACVPITDDGLLRGDGVFEVVRLYAGQPFALDEHLERMAGSARALRLRAFDPGAVRGDVRRLLEAARPGDACLRLVATASGRRFALLEALPVLPPALRLAGVTYAPPRILDGVKSLSYAANMLATRLARERGADEALLVTPHGRVLEGPRQAFFYVRDGALLTPPLSDHILDSITRRRVLAVAGARERVTTLDDLAGAQEAFLASTLREVHPVSAVDDVAFDPVPGEVTARVTAAVRARIEAELGSRALR